ncbi:MAG: hypothetical protein P8Z50_00870, partial [candidate division WOR-3 bacterium]
AYQYGCPIYIDGIEADIQVSSSKDYYGCGENIPFFSLFENGKYGWDGTETLSVYRTETEIEGASIWDIAGKIDTFGLIPDRSGGLVLDSVYSLICLDEGYVSRGCIYSGISIDERDNLWLSVYYSESSTVIEKWDGLAFNRLLDRFELPDSISPVVGIIVCKGIVYMLSWSEGGGRMIYKMNSTSGVIVGSIHPSGREFLDLRDAIVKENDNILALENGTKTLWEFSSLGDSISAFSLPSELEYNSIGYRNGKIYISTSEKIITIQGTVIDSFGFDLGVTSYGSLTIDDKGMIAVTGGWEGLFLFSPEGELECETWEPYGLCDISFYKGNILTSEFKHEAYSYINLYRKYGKENGILMTYPLGDPPVSFLFHSYEGFDVENSGSVLYQTPGPLWTTLNEDLLPLSSLYGAHFVPPVYVNMEGDWQNSPVFNDCILNIKFADLIEPPIIENVYDLNLSASENISFADTIKDTIPAGDYCVVGNVHSDYPQEIASDWKLFTVIEDNVTFLFKTDKEEGFVGDTFKINPLIINPLPLKQDSVFFAACRASGDTCDVLYIDTVISMEAGSVDSLPFTITPEEPLTIRGYLYVPPSHFVDKEFSPIIKSGRILTLNVNTPEIADLSPFRVTTEMYNYSFDDLALEVERIFLSDTLRDSVYLKMENVHTFVDTFSTEQPGTLKVIAKVGNETFEEEKFINFGMNGVVQLDSLYEVSPDSVEMSGIIRNGGVYPLECKALFCLLESDSSHGDTEKTMLAADSQRLMATHPTTQKINNLTNQPIAQSFAVLSAQRVVLSSVHEVGKGVTLSQFVSQLATAGVDTSFSMICLLPGETDTVPILFNRHDVGSYEMQAFLFTDSLDFMFDSASSNVNVVGDNQLFVDTLIVSPNCDTNGNVPLMALIDNRSFGSFAGNITVSSPVCYFDSVISLPLHSKDTLTFLLEDPIDEGIYAFTSVIKEGGVPVIQKLQNIEFHPFYRFDSLPVNLTVSAPDSGIVKIPVSNIGNAKGERNVRVNFADVININEYEIIEPGFCDTFACNYLVPEDFPGGEFFADAAILKNNYPETDTFFNVIVNGLMVNAADSLDKFVYTSSDTTEL